MVCITGGLRPKMRSILSINPKPSPNCSFLPTGFGNRLVRPITESFCRSKSRSVRSPPRFMIVLVSRSFAPLANNVAALGGLGMPAAVRSQERLSSRGQV